VIETCRYDTGQSKENNVKRFIAAMAFAVIAGCSPALAQSWDPDVGSGNIVPPPYGLTLNGASMAQHDGTYDAERGHHRAHAKAPRFNPNGYY
jgi:hypothetical protein